MELLRGGTFSFDVCANPLSKKMTLSWKWGLLHQPVPHDERSAAGSTSTDAVLPISTFPAGIGYFMTFLRGRRRSLAHVARYTRARRGILGTTIPISESEERDDIV